MLRYVGAVLLLVTSAIGQMDLTSTARIPLESVQLLSKLCLSQRESAFGGTWSLSDVGTGTRQYITLTTNSVEMKFIHEEWYHDGRQKVAIAQMIVSVLPDGSASNAACNRIVESESGEVLESTSSPCADRLVQEMLDSMTKRFADPVK